jgi:hypothetical protein
MITREVAAFQGLLLGELGKCRMDLFVEEEDYRTFLAKVWFPVHPWVNTMAWTIANEGRST